jgi:hypothetical protein
VRYHAQCDRLDRLWGGNVNREIEDLRVAIQKAKRRRQDCTGAEGMAETLRIDEQVIELERDVRDLEALGKRIEAHPYEEKFADKKARRGYDMRDEVFEAFELPVEREVEFQEKFNELQARIKKNRGMSKVQKQELLATLQQALAERVSKGDQSKTELRVYRKEG